MSNGILERQNAEEQLELRRAAGQTYYVATTVLVAQFGLSVLIPICGAVLGLFVAESRAYVGAFALLAVVVDVCWLDRVQKSLLKRAAKISEAYDCEVLCIDWDKFVAGDRVVPEDIHRASRALERRSHSIDGFRDWYPNEADDLPIELARFVCQRSNLRYDSQLRQAYGAIVLSIALLTGIGLSIVAVAGNFNVNEILIISLPAAPVFSWCIREYFKHKDTSDQLETLIAKAGQVWGLALSGKLTQAECLAKAREFQGAIFTRRTTAPLIMPPVYRLKRRQLEGEMRKAASVFLEDYRKRGLAA